MGFPHGSHLRQWIFPSEGALLNTMRGNHEKSAQTFLKEKRNALEQAGTPMEDPPPCPLTTEIQLEWAAYVVREGIKICEKKGLDFRVQNTALTFFCRFYLKESMVRYPPEMTLLTCIVAAIKAENLGEPIKLSQIFHDAAQISIADVLKLEAVVLSVLDFHLMVLHVQTPLTALTNEYYRHRARQKDSDFPQEFLAKDNQRSNMTPDMQLHAFVTCLQMEGEALSLELYGGPLPFVRVPSEVAIGVFLYLTTIRYPCKDALDFVCKGFFGKVHVGNDREMPDVTERKFRERALILSNEVQSFCQQSATFFNRWEANNVPGTIRDVRKWTNGAERGVWSKRKKPSSHAQTAKRARPEDT